MRIYFLSINIEMNDYNPGNINDALFKMYLLYQSISVYNSSLYYLAYLDEIMIY